MIQPTIRVDDAQLARVRALLADIGSTEKLALKRAVTRTTASTKVQVSREITNKVTLLSKKVKDNISSSVSVTDTGISGKVTISGIPIPLAAYKVTPTATNMQQYNPNGVTVKVYKDAGAIQLKHGFWAIMKNGHIGLFLRQMSNGRAVPRLKINELLGPALTSVYEQTPQLAQLIEITATEKLSRELDAQVAYILSQHQS